MKMLTRSPRGSIYTTIMELGPKNHNGEGLLGPNSIIVVYMDPLGLDLLKIAAGAAQTRFFFNQTPQLSWSVGARSCPILWPRRLGPFPIFMSQVYQDPPCTLN